MARQSRAVYLRSWQRSEREALATLASGENPDATDFALPVEITNSGESGGGASEATLQALVDATAKGTKTFFATAPTTTAAAIRVANASRISLVFTNNGAQTIYVGKDNTVTTGNGFPLAVGASIVDEDSTDAWWGITASGTGDVRGIEI